MIRLCSAVIIISWFLAACGNINRGILKELGNWRIEIGPAGNEFYEQLIYETQPPPDKLFQLVRDIAPSYTVIDNWEQRKKDEYLIRAKAGAEEYNFVFSFDARLLELEYKNDSTNVIEEPDKLLLKDNKENIELSEVPKVTLLKILKVIPDSVPNQAWITSTVVGRRYVIEVGQTIFYARPDGQIQAAGLKERGALDDIDPPAKKKKQEEIIVVAKEKFEPYRERFNIDSQIAKLGNIAAKDNGSYRFVVIGDSRSNPDLWFSIVKHVDQLDPKPAFVICTGDIVSYGYTEEYLEYFIPPLMETDLNYFVVIGNHDDGSDGQALEYRYLFGENALNYFFDYDKTRYIFFDNVSKVNPYDESLEWLERVLADTPEALHIIVSAHKPIATIEKWAYHSWNKKDSQTFTKLMNKYAVDQVFFGHIHAYSTATLDGVSYTISGGGGAGLHDRYGPLGNVHHYVICDVMPDGSIKLKVVRFYKKDDS